MSWIFESLGVQQERASKEVSAASMGSPSAELLRVNCLRDCIRKFPEGDDPTGLGKLHFHLGSALTDADDFVGAKSALREGHRNAPDWHYNCAYLAAWLHARQHQDEDGGGVLASATSLLTASTV